MSSKQKLHQAFKSWPPKEGIFNAQNMGHSQKMSTIDLTKLLCTYLQIFMCLFSLELGASSRFLCLQRCFLKFLGVLKSFPHFSQGCLAARCLKECWLGFEMFPTGFTGVFSSSNQVCRSVGHTCKKRVMLRRRLFWPKKICGKVRKLRQNVNRDKSA